MGPANRQLQPRPKPLKAVDVAVAVHIFSGSVVDRLMLKTGLVQTVVGRQLVAVDRAALLNVLFDNRMQRLFANVLDNLRHYIAVAFQHPEHDRLARSPTPALAARALAAHIGLVNLDGPAQRPLAVRLGHVLTDLVSHAQGRWVRNAELSLQFFGRNAMARGRE